jgi:4-phytase/acid phosphatase
MNTITSNIEPKPSTQHRKKVGGGFLKAILAGLLLAVVTEEPVLAQTTNAVDDGTVLKQIIIFGRHSIRAAISTTNTLNQFSADPYPDYFGVPVGYLTTNGQQTAGLLGSYFHDYLEPVPRVTFFQKA